MILLETGYPSLMLYLNDYASALVIHGIESMLIKSIAVLYDTCAQSTYMLVISVRIYISMLPRHDIPIPFNFFDASSSSGMF